LATLITLLVAGCGSNVNAPPASGASGQTARGAASSAGAVDDSRLIHADSEPGSWLTTGRTYDEQGFSPIHDINDRNVSQLGIAWYHDLDTNRGQEATPLMVDGVIYTSEAWSRVLALDARTGKQLWEYDPKVSPELGRIACCDVVNRGVAVWKGK